MNDVDWKEVYEAHLTSVAESLGCVAHPNDIAAAARDLRRRAALVDQALAARRATIVGALAEALAVCGVTMEKIALVSDDLDQVARDVTGEL